MRQFARGDNLTFRWLITLIVTTSIITFLLIPGSKTSNYEYSFASFISSFFDISFGRKDLMESIAHLMLFGILTISWYWTLIKHFTRTHAFMQTIIITFILAISTEIGQYFVCRGPSLLDLIANYLGIGLSSLWIHRQLNT